jgi:hypothetical protein
MFTEKEKRFLMALLKGEENSEKEKFFKNESFLKKVLMLFIAVKYNDKIEMELLLKEDKKLAKLICDKLKVDEDFLTRVVKVFGFDFSFKTIEKYNDAKNETISSFKNQIQSLQPENRQIIMDKINLMYKNLHILYLRKEISHILERLEIDLKLKFLRGDQRNAIQEKYRKLFLKSQQVSKEFNIEKDKTAIESCVKNLIESFNVEKQNV